MTSTTKKYVLITGASSGIGYEAAKAFAILDKNLILVARRNDKLKLLENEIKTLHPDLSIVIKTTDLSVTENLTGFYEELSGYHIETWINNAGFGCYSTVKKQETHKIQTMLHLNIEALTILSTLYVRDYQNIDGAQLINVSSAGGYMLVPNAVTYCASKFYVSSFTEGLAWELKAANAKLQAKVLAPAATQTEFGKVANSVAQYDYDKVFGTYHTAKQMAEFLIALYNSNAVVGAVNRKTFEFSLSEPLFEFAGDPVYNQKMEENNYGF